MNRWAAIDFETATGQRASACALGVVCVDEGKVVERRQWLIRPPGNQYDHFNIAVHGITPDRTDDAPDFPQVWEEAQAFVTGRLVIAHNAGFDIGVIRAECLASGFTPADFEYACTLVLARRQWKGLGSYSLPWVCDHLGIAAGPHHDALYDASACALIAARLLVDTTAVDLPAAADTLGVSIGGFGARDVRCTVRDASARFPPANPDADPGHPFYGVGMAFTGTLHGWGRADAAALAAERGATVHKTVTKTTDYLVCGIQDPARLREDGLSGKLRKAMSSGTVQILTELEFAQSL
jgi:DNA polymerase-3 subunit epsilon